MSLALTLSHQVERGYGGSRLTTDLLLPRQGFSCSLSPSRNTVILHPRGARWRVFPSRGGPHRETRGHDVAQSVGPCLRGVAGFVVL